MLVLTSLLLSTISHAQKQTNDLGICYLPNLSDVTYQSLTDLPCGSPSEVISYGRSDQQFGELWLPKRSSQDSSNVALPGSLNNEAQSADSRNAKRHPLVVLIHGGCWLNEVDVRHTHAASTALANAGYAVWAIEYRRVGDDGGGWPNSYTDVLAAIRYIPELAEYPIDTQAVALVGHSAGGQLALLAGAELVSKDFQIDAVIGLAAISDLEQYAAGENGCQRAASLFMGGQAKDKPQAYADATVINKTLHPSTVFIHGTADGIVPLNHSSRFSKQARLIEGAGHFDMIHPATPAFQALLKALAQNVN